MSNLLYQKEIAKSFYEDRYEKGYMQEWPKEKKQRVFEIIKDLNLPENGNAIDFGCGNGVFTDILQQALPNWKIYGCDISKNAVENAKIRFPNCLFFISDAEQNPDIKFDFLFTHHVLEHVYDIKMLVKDMNILLKPKSFILHIFPCGNENSYEYNICKMRIDGINSEMENRFFFEDEGHVRRLTTEQTNNLFSELGFALEKDLYSNQYYGGIKWISESSKDFILRFTDPTKAQDEKARKKLVGAKNKLLFMHYCNKIQKNSFKSIAFQFIKTGVKLILYPLAKIIVSYVEMKAKREWRRKKTQKNGSEMYLFYGREYS